MTGQRPQRALGPKDYRTPTGKRQGLTRVQVEMLLAAQKGRCALCGRGERGLGWQVDHDHEMAKLHTHPVNVGCPKCVRGILCKTCNTALGALLDSPTLLRKAASYVEFLRVARGVAS